MHYLRGPVIGVLLAYSESTINVANAIGKFLDRLFPLPPPERRHMGPLLRKVMGPRIRLDYDPEYLLVLCYKFTLTVYLLFLTLIVCDSYAGTNVLIAPGTFARDKLLIPLAFTRMTAVPTLILAAVFYLRVRCMLDLRRDYLPMRGTRQNVEWMLRSSRWRWIIQIETIIGAMLWGLFNWSRLVVGVNHRVEWGDSLPVVLSQQVIGIVLLAVVPQGLIFLVLFLEKLIRFYPELWREELQRPDYD
jgi:hypothetical protein